MTHRPLYIQLFSLHGLIRGGALELGRDADTGGQITYVVELARHLSTLPQVGRVDLLTRLVTDKSVSPDYGMPIEPLTDKCRIVRIQCGGKRYMRKESLWPHLDEYIDKTIRFIRGGRQIPDIVHGHYPDAGYVAMQLSSIFGLPFVYTGHSLGRCKQARLSQQGVPAAEMNRVYKMDRRIAVEERILANADLVVASTRDEVEKQYGLYQNQAVPAYRVIPPGIDVERFFPYYHELTEENEKAENIRFAQASITQELERFFMHPDKPLILALCRADIRKNIGGLVRAFGEDLDLRAMSNLAVFAGLRKDIDSMPDNEREVLTEMLLLMDKYDLYGKMAIPKKHDFEFEVPALYRVAAAKGGVFVNAALTEPFGLTLLEASATGLPIVATNDGGPNDIIDNCRNGLLVDPTRPREISGSIRRLIRHREKWEECSKNGVINVRKHYTWQSHAESYLAAVEKLTGARTSAPVRARRDRRSDKIGRRLLGLDFFLVTDIDNTLIGEENHRLAELLHILAENRARVGFGVATGRHLASARDILSRHNVPAPDILISSVGSELYYGGDYRFGQEWATHISHRWEREKIVKALQDLDFLEPQEPETQLDYKISYYMAPGRDRLARVHDLLLRHKCRYNVIYSHDRFLDILPYRASKGKAIRYVSYQWDIPLKNFLVCGDSGNDEEMLRGEPLAVIVGNYSRELEALRDARHVFFAPSPCAGGIIEGLKHYDFIDAATRRPQPGEEHEPAK